MKPRVYDRNMNFLGTLDHAMNVSFTHVFNDLWQAGFSLPVRDEENILCQGVHTIVDIPDGQRSAGKYRISGATGTQTVDVMNLKVRPDQTEKALGTDGIYPAYHMNKKNWISVILDDTLADGTLWEWIENSFSPFTPSCGREDSSAQV